MIPTIGALIDHRRFKMTDARCTLPHPCPFTSDRMRRRLLLALICALLAACAGTPSTTPSRPAAPRPAAPAQRPPDPAVLEEARKQAEFAFRQRVQEVSRLYSLFWPLTRAAAPLCEGRSLASIGPSPGTLLAVSEASRPELRRLLGMDERLTFIVVVDNTPAALAGIRAGDILLAVDGQPIAPGAQASRQYHERLAAAATRGTQAELLLERSGQQQHISVPVERICAGSIQTLTNDVVGAYVSGRTIGVTRGMLRFADDRELAIVIGHELAHIALGHTQPPQAPAAQSPVPAVGAGSGASGIAAPSVTPAPAPVITGRVPQIATPEQRAQSQQRELDADVVGLALVAAAGLPIQDAAQLWRRMAATYPATIQQSPLRTHPATPERFIEIERATRDMEGRLARKESLVARSRDGRVLATVASLPQAGPWPVKWVNESLRGPTLPTTERPRPAPGN